MEVSKIHLSAAETELMQDAEIILTKNRILQKMRRLLEEVQNQQIAFTKTQALHNKIFRIAPKISKGENYLGLPYLILDYPRFSSSGDFFFIRTMFWWGKFFSSTLHLSGNSKERFSQQVKQNFPGLKNCYINASGDQWVHDLDAPVYKYIDQMPEAQFKSIIESFNHLKIAKKHSLVHWRSASGDLYESWKFHLRICGLVT
jgi:hypothetical protein